MRIPRVKRRPSKILAFAEEVGAWALAFFIVNVLWELAAKYLF